MDIKINRSTAILHTANTIVSNDINLSIDEKVYKYDEFSQTPWGPGFNVTHKAFSRINITGATYKLNVTYLKNGVLYTEDWTADTTNDTTYTNIRYFKINSVILEGRDSYYEGVSLYNSDTDKMIGSVYYWSSSYSSHDISVDGILVNGNINISHYYLCFLEGTPITLSNGSTKSVEEITYDDELLVWDFDNAEFASAKPLWIMKEQKATQYNHLVFSDGSELNTINQHRIFNVEKGMFTYPMTDDTPIGTTTFNDKGEFVTLVSKEVVEKEVKYYNIITDYHINLFAGSILTSCRLSNIYPIVDMKYVKDDREIIPLSEFNVPEEYYYGFRLGEQPTDINREGAVSFGDESVEDYVNRLIGLRKE